MSGILNAPSKELEALIQGIAHLDRMDEVDEHMSELRRAINPSFDMNQVCDGGEYTPMGLLVRMDDSYLAVRRAMSETAKLLFEAGANPLAEFSVANMEDSELATVMMAHLMERERNGTPLKDSEGGNLLHSLARNDPRTLRIYLDWNTQLECPFDKRWIHEADGQGRTPLQTLFAPESIVSILSDSRAANEQFQSVSLYLSETWDSLDLLLGLGVDLRSTDTYGKTVAETIVDCVRNGLPVDREQAQSFQMIEALVEQDRLASSTASAKKGLRTGNRL